MNIQKLCFGVIVAGTTAVIIGLNIHDKIKRKQEAAECAEIKADILAMRLAKTIVRMRMRDGYYWDNLAITAEEDWKFFTMLARYED